MLINWVEAIENAIEMHGMRLDESFDYLKLHFKYSQPCRDVILNLIETAPADAIVKILILHDEISEDLPSLTLSESSLGDDDACSIIFTKKIIETTFFITSSGFKKSINNITKYTNIYINSTNKFSTLTCDFIPILDYELGNTNHNISIDSEDSFATFTSGRIAKLIDLSIPFFILKTNSSEACAFFQEWKIESCQNLINLVGNKIEIENNITSIIIKSDRKVSFTLNTVIKPDCFKALQDCMQWVILPRRDAKTRHQMLIGCLIREGEDTANIWDFIKSTAEHALESAQLSYDSLLDKETRESLKVMIDIRKAVFDAASQISKEAQELSSRAAADIAAVAGLLIARAALLGKDSISPLMGIGLLALAILYIIYRVHSVLYIAKEFFSSTDTAREAWNKRVYSNLSIKDREELSEKPIERAKLVLKKAVDVASIAYSLIIFLLLITAFLSI